MINGVMHIVAAVLFGVISIKEGTNVIWMGIAGIYLDGYHQSCNSWTENPKDGKNCKES